MENPSSLVFKWLSWNGVHVQGENELAPGQVPGVETSSERGCTSASRVDGDALATKLNGRVKSRECCRSLGPRSEPGEQEVSLPSAARLLTQRTCKPPQVKRLSQLMPPKSILEEGPRCGFQDGS